MNRKDIQRVENNKIEVKKLVESEAKRSKRNNEEPLLSSLEATLKGNMSTKMAAVVSELKLCALWHEPARIVLFSQFPEMLPVIQKACAENGLRDHICFGTGAALARSIDTFKKRCLSERFVVLLLPISKGAEGLTLTEANMIFLLEPAWPIALETQAVARIDRIGQQHKKLYVYRFIVRGTVEQRLVEVAREEKKESADESDMKMSVDLSKKLLQRPQPDFQVSSHDNDGLVDGLDEDERWWLTKVRGGKTRREFLETFLKNDNGEGYEVLHGVEVPAAAVKLLTSLK